MKPLQLLILLALCLVILNSNAQINIKDKVKNAVSNRANTRTDEGIEKGLDNVENEVKDALKKKEKNTENSVEGIKEEDFSVGSNQSVNSDSNTPSLQSYSKFDFIPGEKLIFFDDFSKENVGDFPALWFSNGSGEVKTLNNYPGKWLHFTGDGCYYPEIDLQTGENFTVEFDMICNYEVGYPYYVGFYLVSGNIKDYSEGGAIPGVAGVITTFSPTDLSFSSYSNSQYILNGRNDNKIVSGEIMHVSYWVQKQRLRIYVNERKVIDAPRAVPLDYKYNILRFQLREGKPYISNFRVASGAPDTRNKLVTEGKLVTYGIYFDINKDVVKPESYGTLKDIAAVLNEVPEIKVKIFGHTDSDGTDEANLDLSKRRAASVKKELVQLFGVESSRLETDGMGESQPIAPNDNPANKALNRRVELIKM